MSPNRENPVRRYDKHYVKEGKFNLAFFSTLVIIWCYYYPLFLADLVLWKPGYTSAAYSILTPTGKIWYVRNDTSKNTLIDLVSTELNSIKAVYHPICVCQYDLKYNN